MNATVVLVVLRESLEAMLILGLLTAVIYKSGERRALRWVYMGALGGVLAATAAGFAIYKLPDLLSEGMLNWFAVLAPLLAAALIVQVIWVMRRQGQESGHRLVAQVQSSLSRESLWGLAAASFLAVGREGFETVLFLGGEILDSHGAALLRLIFSAAVGFGLAIAAYLIFQTSLRRVGMFWFFRVTMVLLLATAAYLVVDSYHKAAMIGLI